MSEAVDDLTALRQALPDYRIDRPLGRGQFGVVFAGNHLSLDRDVAVKRLVAGVSADPQQHERFRREARILATLDHQHIVRVFDFRDAVDGGVLVMERLTGGTLADRIAVGIDPPSMVMAVVAAASALHHVHQQGLLHRDVTPQNLMFNALGVLKVTDFGTAASLWTTGDQDDAAAGQLVGTPGYLAPEQACAALGLPALATGPAADQYGLAAVLFHQWSGRFTHDSQGGSALLLRRRVALPADPLPAPAPIARAVAVALSRDPQERYPTVEAFALALIDACGVAWGAGWAHSSEVRVLEPGVLADAVRQVGGEDSGSGTGSGRTPVSRRAALLIGGAVGTALIGGSAALWSARDRATTRSAVDPPATVSSSGSGTAEAALTSMNGDSPRSTFGAGWVYRTGGKVVATALVTAERVIIGSTDTHVHAIDRVSGGRAWATPTGGQVWATARLIETTTNGAPLTLAVVGSHDGQVYAFRPESGAIHWQQPVQHQITAAVAAVGATVIVAADQVYTFDAGTGAPGPTFPTRGGVIGSPVVAGTVVFVGTLDGYLHAIDVAGSPVWEVPLDGPVRAAPVVLGETVFVGTAAGTVHAFALNAAPQWQYQAQGAVEALSVIDGLLSVSSNSGYLELVTTHHQRYWQSTQLPGTPHAAARSGDRVVAGCTDGWIYSFDPTSGVLLDWLDLGASSLLSSPVVTGSEVIIGCLDGTVRQVLLR